MRTLLIGLAALASVAAPQVAAASCADFRAAATDLSLQYDPFSAAALDRVFTLRISRSDPAVTAVRFILVDTNGLAGQRQIGTGPEGYEIEWTKDTSRAVLFSGAEQPNATNGALVSFGPDVSGGVVSESFRFRLPAGQDAGAGDYFEPLEVRFVCYSGDEVFDAPEFQLGNGLAIDLSIPESISTYIGSAGVRRGEINFGPLDINGGVVSRSLAVTAQSTMPYDVDVQTKWGQLQRSEADKAGIAYGVTFAGISVADGSRLACSRTPAPAGRGHLLSVQLDQSRARLVAAGSYSDVITLTFTPRLGLSSPNTCASAG